MAPARRTVLGALLALPAALGGFRAGGAAAVAPDADTVLIQRLRAQVSHRESALLVCSGSGLAGSPSADLLRRLCPGPAERRRLAGAPPRALRRWLAEAIRQDFADRRMVRVNGWLLAETEVTAAAIAAG